MIQSTRVSRRLKEAKDLPKKIMKALAQMKNSSKIEENHLQELKT